VVILAHTMQSKNWVVTINNWKEEDVEAAKGWPTRYILMGSEVAPETGTKHLQGCVQFLTNMRMAALKKLHTTAHWEIMRGSIEQSETYCKKDGNIVLEQGEKKSRET